MARCALWMTAALAAFSVAAALTQPSADETGVAFAAGPSTTTPGAPTTVAVTTTTTPPPPPPPTTRATTPPPTTAPRPVVTTPRPAATTPPTTAASPVYASGARESCGWTWDATHFDDGTLNEVTLVMEAPRRPNTPVTMTAKPGASALKSFATTTDAQGYASMVISLSNDKRDWSLTIGAQFPGSRCDARSFTIAY
jgi:hypothetical protein